MLTDNIKNANFISSLETKEEKVSAVIQSFNMAHLLMNNLKHLMKTNTTFSTLLGSEEASNEYFYNVASKILSIRVYMDEHLANAIPKYHDERAQ